MTGRVRSRQTSIDKKTKTKGISNEKDTFFAREGRKFSLRLKQKREKKKKAQSKEESKIGI